MMIRSTVLLLSLVFALPATAAEMRPFRHDGGSTRIPVAPQRIVALNDHTLAMPLVELGAPLVGSAGRIGNDGEPFLRGIEALLGVTFENSPIEFVGVNPVDIEKVVALRPDLIITMPWQSTPVDQLAKIAPTIVIDPAAHDLLGLYRMIADAAGMLDAFEARLARYEALIRRARRMIPNAGDISISLIQAHRGRLLAYKDFGAISQAMDDIGFAVPAAIAKIEGDYAEFSAEALPKLDADFMIDTYSIALGHYPRDVAALMETVLPGWCHFLHACRHRQYILLPRTQVTATSFAALSFSVRMLVSHIAGRDYVPLPPR